MFRYKLRTLLIVLALGPVALTGGWYMVNGGRYAGALGFVGFLATIFCVIAYWPRICGKGG
jgi:hypothetical protein